MATRKFKPIPDLPQSQIERFWSAVDIGCPNDCWTWKKSVNAGGYGLFCFGSSTTYIATRVAWKLNCGADPGPLFVCHDCPGGDNPSCTNPAHLYLGTALENNVDTANKHRDERPRKRVRAPFKLRRLPPLTESAIERFWRLVDRRGDDECWLWKGSFDIHGYGRFAYDYEQYHATRISYFLSTGADPYPDLACHKCNVPACVNPRHLFPGTHQQNTDQCIQQGRVRMDPPVGERSSFANLNREQVIEIRRLFNVDNLNASQISRQYGINPTTVMLIVRGKTWAHVPDYLTEDVACRSFYLRGEDAPQSILKAEDVRLIRAMHATGEFGYIKLGKRFNVHPVTVCSIVRRKTWKHI